MRSHILTMSWIAAVFAVPACGDTSIETSGGGGGDSPEEGDEAPVEPGVCGDGLVAADELCDDANQREGDGCNSDCRPSGERVWCLDDVGPSDVATIPTAMAVGPTGDIAVIGTISNTGSFTAWLEVFDGAGVSRWRTEIPNAGGNGVAFFSNGGLAVAIHEVGATSSRITSFSAEGVAGNFWTADSGIVRPQAFVVGPGDALVVAGNKGTADEAWTATFSTELVLQHEATYQPSRGTGIEVRGVTIDRSGATVLGADVVLEPLESDAGTPRTGIIIAALLASGDLAWDHVFESPDRALSLSSLAMLGDSSIVATGIIGLGFSHHVWSASLSQMGVKWEDVRENANTPNSGTSVTPLSASDFLLTSVVSRDEPYGFIAAFGRYDEQRAPLWEREHSVPGRKSGAQVSARSGGDHAVVLSGFSDSSTSMDPQRAWLCKFTE